MVFTMNGANGFFAAIPLEIASVFRATIKPAQ
jgi:hypothetical protein